MISGRGPDPDCKSSQSMRDARRLRTLLACCLLLLPATARPAANEPPPPSWLQSLMARMAAITERHENFQEEKRFAALDQPLRSSGQLIYVRPAYLSKITTGPEPETLVVDGDRLTLTTADRQTRSFRVDRRPEISALVDAVRGTLAGNLDLLETHFKVSVQGGNADWTLVLTPVEPDVRRLIQNVVVGGHGTDIRTLRIIGANQDQQIMTITEQQ
jgi:outer membrane lipoprotein-sorting protein